MLPMNSNDKQITNNNLGQNQPTTQPVAPMGTPGISKEKEFIKAPEPVIKELGTEQELPKEIKEAGVIVKQEKLEIPPDLAQMGVRPTGFATPVPYASTIKLPITDEKIEEGRHASIFSSLRWLSEWCLFILKRFHFTLKIIGGKVLRLRR